jgi:serine/threonine protein kinase
LKPQNCFIDDAEGVVKVGDFGLSRESSTSTDITNNNESYEDVVAVKHPSSREAENTVGVGTRAYASPEQMRGSDYDASTDVFSLGLILFELLYPMYTAMERYKEFANVRKGNFPAYWNSQVRSSFPTVHDLLIQMISDSASARPTADAVSERIDSLLREYSIQSLDKSWGTKGALLLRVEAKDRDGILATTMQLIRDAAPLAKVLQYGLRGQNSKAVMEFALEVKDDEKLKTMRNLRSRLEDNDMSIRQVTNS